MTVVAMCTHMQNRSLEPRKTACPRHVFQNNCFCRVRSRFYNRFSSLRSFLVTFCFVTFQSNRIFSKMTCLNSLYFGSSEGQKKLGKMTIRSHVGQNLSLPGTTEAVSAELLLKGKIRISLILAGFLLNN